jgi:hypothetical protein
VNLLNALKEKYPDIEVDSKEYRAFMITASKNYLAYPATPTKSNPDMKPVVKGVKGAKSNESKWINNIQKFIVAHAVDGREKIVEYLKDEYEKFISGNLDKTLLKRKIQIHKEPSTYPNICVEKIIGSAQGKHAEDIIWYFDIDRGKNKAKKQGWDKLSFEERARRYQNPDLISKDLYVQDLKTTFEKQFQYIGIDFDKDIINVGQ